MMEGITDGGWFFREKPSLVCNIGFVIPNNPHNDKHIQVLAEDIKSLLVADATKRPSAVLNEVKVTED